MFDSEPLSMIQGTTPKLCYIEAPVDVDVCKPSAAVVTGWFRVIRPWPASTMHGPRDENPSTGDGSGSANAPPSPLALVCGQASQASKHFSWIYSPTV